MDQPTVLPPTPFTRAVGCALPLQQAAMGGVATPALAAAVARAGGLGMLAGVGRSAEAVTADVAAAVDLAAGGKVGVGFLVPFLDPDALAAAAAVAPLVELFYGEPQARVVAVVHDGGALAAWQVGSAAEAGAAVDAGCDVVVVQGCEAGGHVRGSVALLPLLDEVCPAVGVPVVAAGGIGSGRVMAAALAAGAAAVRVGTRFVATVEADVHPAYTAALVEAGAADTVLTTAFSMGWPDAPHRVLGPCVAASSAPSSRRSPSPPGRGFAGSVAEAALYAGQSVGAVRRVEPAADVVRQLVADAARALADATHPDG